MKDIIEREHRIQETYKISTLILLGYILTTIVVVLIGGPPIFTIMMLVIAGMLEGIGVNKCIQALNESDYTSDDYRNGKDIRFNGAKIMLIQILVGGFVHYILL